MKKHFINQKGSVLFRRIGEGGESLRTFIFGLEDNLMSRVECPCSFEIAKINDGKGDVFYGECQECVSNKGNYALSSQWKEPVFAPPVSRMAGPFDDDNVLPFPKTVKGGAKAGKKKVGGERK